MSLHHLLYWELLSFIVLSSSPLFPCFFCNHLHIPIFIYTSFFPLRSSIPQLDLAQKSHTDTIPKPSPLSYSAATFACYHIHPIPIFFLSPGETATFTQHTEDLGVREESQSLYFCQQTSLLKQIPSMITEEKSMQFNHIWKIVSDEAVGNMIVWQKYLSTWGTI